MRHSYYNQTVFEATNGHKANRAFELVEMSQACDLTSTLGHTISECALLPLRQVHDSLATKIDKMEDGAR